MSTLPFCSGDIHKAKVLVIGHDPRLQESDTLAGYAFFANYYFRAIPTNRSEFAKYRLAQAVYEYVAYLTSHRYVAGQIALTNLCNESLPHAPKGKIVYIPEDSAQKGIDAIRQIMAGSEIEVIFPMSVQVNYWLQKLGFYPPVSEYLSAAEPRSKGVCHQPPYYEQSRSKAFTHICGKCYRDQDNRRVHPILHVKNWPLKGSFAAAYAKAYTDCVNSLKEI